MGLLSKLGRGKSKERKANSQTCLTSPAAAQRIKNILSIRELRSMPVQAARAFQLACDPTSSRGDFADVISADEAMSARIMRIANSVYFSRGEEARELDQAIGVIGLDELRCLISATMLRGLLQGKHPIRDQIWANSVATAIGAHFLSSFANEISSGEAFLSGLLHDVGKLIMLQQNVEATQRVFEIVGCGEKTFIEAEEIVFETNHVEVGKWVAETWNFPQEVVLAITNHHMDWPERSANGGEQEVEITTGLLVKIADIFAHRCGYGHPSNFRGFRQAAKEELPTALACLGIEAEKGEQVLEQFKKRFDSEFSLYEQKS